MRTQKASQAIFVRNPLSLFLQLEPQLAAVTDPERTEMIRLSVRNILRFRAADGGFANNWSERYGTTNGTAQAVTSRYAMRHLAGLPESPLPGAGAFFDGQSKNRNATFEDGAAERLKG